MLKKSDLIKECKTSIARKNREEQSKKESTEEDDGLKATSTAICMYLSLDFYLLRKLSFRYSGRIFEQVSASDFKCIEPSFDSHDHESIVKKLNGYLGCTC